MPILPSEPPKVEARFDFEDYHHHFHPRNDERLRGAGIALRYSRGQIIHRTLHNRYHALFLGPPIPEEDSAVYRLSVLACAGVVPRQAIDLSQKGQFETVDIPRDIYVQLTSHKSIGIEKAHKYDGNMHVRKTLGRFFAMYAVRQHICSSPKVSQKVIEEFIDEATSPERKKELGNFILKEALGYTVDELAPLEQKIDDEGFRARETRRPLISVVRRFTTKEIFPEYHPVIGERLREQYSQVA